MRKLPWLLLVLVAGCGGQLDPGATATTVDPAAANGDTAAVTDVATSAASPTPLEPGDDGALQVAGGRETLELMPGDGTFGIESLLAWWHSRWTWDHWTSYGWDDTDLAVSSSTAIQLRHASKLVGYGTYAWGYMPTFVDTVTGDKFKFLHLRPQHERATIIGHVYPAGYVVGYSGGDTWDTGGAGRGYSTGAHLCVQTLVGFRRAFPW
ncbi:MAG TPA: hypothetical protein VF997_03060 [Polyangia bacterium]